MANNQNQPPQINTGIGFLIIFLIGGGIVWWFMSGGQVPSVAAPGVIEGSYEYRVTSSCPVNVTYGVGQTGTEQQSNVSSGWTKTVTTLVPQVLAQLTCEGGTVTAEIYQNGNLYKTATSNGDFVIAHAAP